MVSFIAVVHIVVAVLLILFVLLQDSKGGAMGSSFGGGNANSLLGATGAATFLSKLTLWVVVVFGITCLLLTKIAMDRSESVVDNPNVKAVTAKPAEPQKAPETAPAPAPAQPAQQNPAQPQKSN